tara:strand:+ start:923 stop:1294 length:372 start_codon:yes stop_codon:yes gene_type:complete
MLCLVTLALRLVIPSGYMINSDHGRFAITLCSGVAPQPSSAMMDMHDMTSSDAHHGESEEHRKPDMPCAFSALSVQALGGAPLVLLIAALAAIATIALLAVPRSVVATAAYLRPPLRGPPLLP